MKASVDFSDKSPRFVYANHLVVYIKRTSFSSSFLNLMAVGSNPVSVAG